ncbi:hypothetical protein ACFLZW_01955, partial [Chloroflexota bacterium]
MIIHQPEKIVAETDTILWTKVELSKEIAGFPQYLWYRTPNRYGKFFSTRCDAFLLPGLIAAMGYGEDIEVRGAVSPRLAYHLEEYQSIQKMNFGREVRRTLIKYDRLEALEPALDPARNAVGFSFSGGVDSFFTLLKHTPEHLPSSEYQISHALFINGFDFVLNKREKYQNLCRRYKEALKEIDVELIPMETNIASMIITGLRFNFLYSPTLAGCAISLAGLFKRFIISSSWDYHQLQHSPHTSNPLSDRMLSTETIEFEHFGANYRRVEKVAAISNWKPAQEHLRVCAQLDLDDHTLNCSKCGKCIRTMLPIYTLGKMASFQTFHKPLRTDRDLLRWARKFDPYPEYLPETVAFLRQHKPGLLLWLFVATVLGMMRVLMLALLP